MTKILKLSSIALLISFILCIYLQCMDVDIPHKADFALYNQDYGNVDTKDFNIWMLKVGDPGQQERPLEDMGDLERAVYDAYPDNHAKARHGSNAAMTEYNCNKYGPIETWGKSDNKGGRTAEICIIHEHDDERMIGKFGVKIKGDISGRTITALIKQSKNTLQQVQKWLTNSGFTQNIGQ